MDQASSEALGEHSLCLFFCARAHGDIWQLTGVGWCYRGSYSHSGVTKTHVKLRNTLPVHFFMLRLGEEAARVKLDLLQVHYLMGRTDGRAAESRGIATGPDENGL